MKKVAYFMALRGGISQQKQGVPVLFSGTASTHDAIIGGKLTLSREFPQKFRGLELMLPPSPFQEKDQPDTAGDYRRNGFRHA